MKEQLKALQNQITNTSVQIMKTKHVTQTELTKIYQDGMAIIDQLAVTITDPIYIDVQSLRLKLDEMVQEIYINDPFSTLTQLIHMSESVDNINLYVQDAELDNPTNLYTVKLTQTFEIEASSIQDLSRKINQEIMGLLINHDGLDYEYTLESDIDQ